MGPDASDSATEVELSSAVLSAVADREGVAPTDLDRPLFDVIDPDALDVLFDRGSGHVTFTYLDYTVTAHSDGRVELEPAAE